MRRGLLIALAAAWPLAAFARGDGTFQSALKLDAVNATAVVAGDFNGDGRPDLAALSYSNLTVFLQGPRSRLDWTKRSARLARGAFTVRSADLDADGDDDLVASDPGSGLFVLMCRGDGATFEAGTSLERTSSSRDTAIGDFDGDGKLDLASANHGALTMSVFRGAGDGTFTLIEEHQPGDEPHSITVLDHDGDGRLDLAVSLPTGVLLYQGAGDGTFERAKLINWFACHHSAVQSGDLNGDGRDDLVTECGVALTRQGGHYILQMSFGAGAVGDFNGDGYLDIARLGGPLAVHPGNGDGTFRPPVSFGATWGNDFRALLTEDLDRDGRDDLVIADSSTGITMSWGLAGERPLESGYQLDGLSAVKSFGLGDLDGDSSPDLFLPSSTQGRVDVYPNRTLWSSGASALSLATGAALTGLEVVDLDGNGIPDLAGVNDSLSRAVVVLLGDRAGRTRTELDLPCGLRPSDIVVERLDLDQRLDLAVASTGSNRLDIFLARPEGGFGDPRLIPTARAPRKLAAGDLDGDGRNDLAVASSVALAVHHGDGLGSFLEAELIGNSNFLDVGIADMDGDQRQDLVAIDIFDKAWISRGTGSRGLHAPLMVPVGRGLVSLALHDLDDDGLPDLTAGNGSARSISVVLNRGPGGFSPAVQYHLGFAPRGHRVADLDLDGSPDLIAFTLSQVVILAGNDAGRPPPSFRRGDANSSGRLDVGDAILVLTRLFLGGEPIACEDAADANDDGRLSLSDPVRLLLRLFRGGAPLPPPGPEDCGEDPTGDGLAACTAGC